MATPTFSLNIPPGSVSDVVGYAREAEDLGFTEIGIWDSPALFREPWVVLAAVAQATRSATICTSVTNPLTRHPVVTASAAASVEELAPGRVYIGIGSGDSGVYNLGYTAARVADLRAYVSAVKALFAEGEAEFQGRRCILPWAKGRRIRVYMSAHGARTLRAAAQVADGVIAGLGVTPEVIAGTRELIGQAAREAGRDPAQIDVVQGGGTIYVDPRPGEALKRGAWHVIVATHHLARFTLEGKFIPERYRAGIKKLGDAYDISQHGAVSQTLKDRYDQLAREVGVRDYLMERFLLAGTPDEVEEAIRNRMRLGCNRFEVALTAGGMGHARLFATEVMPRFRRGGRG